MIPGGGYSVNTNASAATDTRQTGGGIFVGGLNTGTQGVDLKSLAIVAAVVIVIVLVIGRRK